MRGFGTNFLYVDQHIGTDSTWTARIYRNATRGSRYGVAVCLDGIHGDPNFNGWEPEELLAVYDAVVCVRGGGRDLYRDKQFGASMSTWSVFLERQLPDYLESVGIADPIVAIYGVSAGADVALMLAQRMPTVNDVYCVSGYYWWNMRMVDARLRNVTSATGDTSAVNSGFSSMPPAKSLRAATGFTVHLVAGLGLPGARCTHDGWQGRMSCLLWELLSLWFTILLVFRCVRVRQRFTLLLVVTQRHCWASWRGIGKRLHTQGQNRTVRVTVGEIAA